MKIIKILSITAVLLLSGCQGNKPVPRGVDEAGVWIVVYSNDSFGDPTRQPFLLGTIYGGEYSGLVSSWFRGRFEETGDGKLTLRYYLKRARKKVKQDKKDTSEDIPTVDITFSYKTPKDTSYYYSHLWKEYKDWDIKFVTEGQEPFTCRECFDSDDYRCITLRGADAEKIMMILTHGTETVVRAKCKDSSEHDEYIFRIDKETLNDLPDVLTRYRYHYFEYQREKE